MADPITWGLINLVKKGVKSVQTTLDGVSDKVSGLPDSLDADFTEVKNAISGVKTDVGGVKSDINSVKTGIGEIKTENTSSFTDVKNSISGVSSKVDGVGAKIDTVSGWERLTQNNAVLLDNMLENNIIYNSWDGNTSFSTVLSVSGSGLLRAAIARNYTFTNNVVTLKVTIDGKVLQFSTKSGRQSVIGILSDKYLLNMWNKESSPYYLVQTLCGLSLDINYNFFDNPKATEPYLWRSLSKSDIVNGKSFSDANPYISYGYIPFNSSLKIEVKNSDSGESAAVLVDYGLFD